MERERLRHSIDDNDILHRSRSVNLWRPSSISNFLSGSRDDRRNSNVLHLQSSGRIPSSRTGSDDNKSTSSLSILKEKSKRGWNTIVTVDVVGAKGLPDPPYDSSGHQQYCKIVLGSETQKTKKVQSSRQPEWKERFTLHLKKDHLLQVSLWDKGRWKNSMGSCVIDLSNLEKERTHELFQSLDGGFGAIHLIVTLCAVRTNRDVSDNGPSLEEVKKKFDFYNFQDWHVVGQLHVKLIGARGFNGKHSAYCTLEIANVMVQTPSTKLTSEPMWNKNYVLDVHDVTNTLDLKVFDNSFAIATVLGKVTIPLLRIRNGEPRWYALKSREGRSIARGNYPRVLLEMTLIFNPIKASLRLFRPMKKKYVAKKPAKLDIGLLHTNLIFIRDLFNLLFELNENIKHVFEWDNRELSTVALALWLLFWFFFRPWALPLLLLIPFSFFMIFWKDNNQTSSIRRPRNEDSEHNNEDIKPQSLTSKISEMPDVVFTITTGIWFMQSLWERVFNLISFKLPFVSYMVMVLLAISSVGLYIIPFNYIMMGVGIYKYTRKHLNPDREPNNDILDLIMRLPDNEILKDWEELTVPEPQHQRYTSTKIEGSRERLSRSYSSNL